MVSYLKIEIFAYDLFHTVWLKGGLISRKYDAIQIYKDECLSDYDYEEICDKLIYDAVLCRRILFQQIYREEIMKGKDTYWNSVSDFYEYVNSTCNRYNLFGCLTVFEKLFATCAFVLNLCFYNRGNENVDIIKFGHICWAAYFGAFSEQFYEQGGWKQLKNVAHSYTLPLEFLQVCLNEPENARAEVTRAIENYNNFKQTSIIHECETVSMLWIKTNVENLHELSNNRVEFVSHETCMPSEVILNELKRLCNPCALEVLQYDEECSMRSVFDSDSFYIPLTPIPSEGSIVNIDSSSNSSDKIGYASSLLSSLEMLSECETDSNITNQSCLNELEDITSSNYCEDILNGSLDMFKQPSEFESISVISDRKQNHYVSRYMTKMRLNHDTLELEETKNSETDDISSSSNDRYSGEDHVPGISDQVTQFNEMMNKQCQMFEHSVDVELVTMNESMKILSVTEDEQSDKNCEFASMTSFLNVMSFQNQISMSISEWDENDLEKNSSTPYKIKTILDKD